MRTATVPMGWKCQSPSRRQIRVVQRLTLRAVEFKDDLHATAWLLPKASGALWWRAASRSIALRAMEHLVEASTVQTAGTLSRNFSQ